MIAPVNLSIIFRPFMDRVTFFKKMDKKIDRIIYLIN